MNYKEIGATIQYMNSNTFHVNLITIISQINAILIFVRGSFNWPHILYKIVFGPLRIPPNPCVSGTREGK